MKYLVIGPIDIEDDNEGEIALALTSTAALIEAAIAGTDTIDIYVGDVTHDTYDSMIVHSPPRAWRAQ